jgi:hypothetical protein
VASTDDLLLKKEIYLPQTADLVDCEPREAYALSLSVVKNYLYK